MSWDAVCETVCPIAQSLSVVGDRWTLLIMRELSMGSRRFDDIHAQTGMSPHLLSTRLKRLEQDGIIERRAYSQRPPRYEYYATRKGRELDPILAMLRAWGAKWGEGGPDGEPAVALVHKQTGEPLDGSTPITGAFSFRDYTASIGKAFSDERKVRRENFAAAKRAPKA